jgi:hypothetical protein
MNLTDQELRNSAILDANFNVCIRKEGEIIGTRRRGRRRKQLLDDFKEARRY